MPIITDSALSRISSGLKPAGFYSTGAMVPGKVVMECDVNAYSTSSGAFVDLRTWTNQTGFTAGGKLELYTHIPSRNDAPSDWGGVYIEKNISFNNGTTFFSLGNGGYDGGCMNYQGDDIHYENNFFWIDPNQATSYSVLLKFRYAVYSNTVGINNASGHDINGSGSNPTQLTNASSNLQHFMHYILREWIPAP